MGKGLDSQILEDTQTVESTMEAQARAELTQVIAKLGPNPTPGLSGFHEDPTTEELWGSKTALAREVTSGGTPISQAGLAKRFRRRKPTAPSIKLDINGISRQAHKLSDAVEITEDLAVIEIYLKESGIFVDENGKKWATIEAMCKKFNLSKPAVTRRLLGVENKPARNCYLKPTTVYDFAAAKAQLKDLLTIRKKAKKGEEIKVDETGRYIEPPIEDVDEPTTWITIHAFYSELPEEIQQRTSTAALRRYANQHCRSQEAVDRHQRVEKATIYPLDELNNLSIINNEVRVDEDGIYTDDYGEEWASSNTWQDILNVSQKGFDRGINTEYEGLEWTPSIQGFGLSKREDPLYPREAVENALKYIFEADDLEVNGIMTKINEGEEGITETIYATVDEIVLIIPEEIIPRYTYRRKFAPQRVTSINRVHGGEVATFDLNAIINHFRDRIQEQLGQIERASLTETGPRQGKLISLSDYLQRHPEKNKKSLIANTDIVEKHRRLNEEGEIVYLYDENELDEISQAA